MKKGNSATTGLRLTAGRILLSGSITALLALAIVVAQWAMAPRDVAAVGLDWPNIPSGGTVSSGPGVLRTKADWVRDANLKPAAPVTAGATINGPTIPLDEYRSLQAWNATNSASASKGAPSAPLSPTPSVKGVNFAGATQGESGRTGFFPPDANMAVGLTQLLQPTNASIDVWSKPPFPCSGVACNPTNLLSVSQNTFTGSTDTLGDARAIYDKLANRWIMIIDDFSGLTNGAKPSYFLCISNNSDATAGFLVYPVSISTSPSGLFYDYPQLGQDQDAILMSANMFQGNSFFGSLVHSIAKQRVYNGAGFNFGIFFASASSGTLAPPNLQNLDQNQTDFFLAAPVGSGITALDEYKMTNSSRQPVGFSNQGSGPFKGPLHITVPSYTTPPPAGAQPSPCNVAADKLDALDGRFQQASFQFSNSVWNVHTETLAGFPAPTFFQIAGAAGTLIQSGQFFKSNTSFDFNPSIFGVNSTVFVTWTATDPTNALNPSVMYGSRNQTDSNGVMNINATPAFTSPACLTGDFDSNFGLQRWGDYSSVSLDPSNGLFWILNETVPSAAGWGTQGVRIGM